MTPACLLLEEQSKRKDQSSLEKEPVLGTSLQCWDWHGGAGCNHKRYSTDDEMQRELHVERIYRVEGEKVTLVSNPVTN